MTRPTVELGVHRFGAYIPALRVNRAEIVSANLWANSGLGSWKRSERSTCGWDEDTVTMSVEAAREALGPQGRDHIGGVYLGTTTPPFEARLNSGIVAAALRLPDSTPCWDVTGSDRAGTSALLAAFDTAAARGVSVLCVASERRATPVGTIQEVATGHAASALLVAPGAGVARLLAWGTVTVDFVDHYRPRGGEFDYHWEERWVRDEGYLKILPRAIEAALADAGLNANDIDRLCLQNSVPRAAVGLAKQLKIRPEALADPLEAGCGETGAAHPLLLLAAALEVAKPGERIVVASFGQGADALVFEVTDAVEAARERNVGVSKWLSRRIECTYPRYQSLAGLVKTDRGLRAEADKQTAHTMHYRNRDLLDSMIGGRCTTCGTAQIPRTRICVNPECGAWDTQEPQPFAEFEARVLSWSADHLTYTPDPPAYYGMVEFEPGGRLLMDFTDLGPEKVDVGTRMRMVFRIKDRDVQRGFTRYFWKAVPTGPQGGD
jgi:3-hydroxy-3-methylglutaryl CoA synthase